MTPIFKLAARALTALALVSSCVAAFAGPLPGAIFTTRSDGSQVNGNIFSAKCDGQGVYLDGGPGINAPADAAGLPDGDYFYQVTDPSGKTLLSTDLQRYRRFTVVGGRIASRVAPAAAGDHDTGLDVDHGAVTIELCPFLDTPNNGGEYKVWVTPVANFAGNPDVVDNGYNPGYFHGFLPSWSKTDNFKINARKSVCLTLVKFEDSNGNGRQESNEGTLQWPIRVFDALGTEVQGLQWTATLDGKTPVMRICALQPGDYTVVEQDTLDSAYTFRVTANILDNKVLTPPSRSVVVRIGTSNRTLVFGNQYTGP